MLVWQGHKGKVQTLAFSPDGRHIATTTDTKFVYLWDASSGNLVRQFESVILGPVRVVAFIPDGKHVAAFYEGRRGGCVWNAETGDVVTLLRTDAGQLHRSIAVRPGGTQLLYPLRLGMAVWDDPTRACEFPRKYDKVRTSNYRSYWPVRIGYSPAGTYLWRANCNVCLLDADTHRLRRLLEAAGCAASTADGFSADESRMAVGFGHRALVWRLDKLKAEPVELSGHGAQVRAVGFLPDGQVLTAGMDGTARLWNADTGGEVRSFDWGIGKVRVAAVSPDGLTCAAGGENGQVFVWDVDA